MERGRITRRDVNLGLIAGAVALAVPGAARAGAATHLFDFLIAGGGFHNLWQVRDGLPAGTRLHLRAEPENPYDAFAVAVERADGLMLGYIPRMANEPIADMLAQGLRIEAEVLGVSDFWNEAALDDLVVTDVGEGDPVVRLTLML